MRYFAWLLFLWPSVGAGAELDRPPCDPRPQTGVLGSMCGLVKPEDLEWAPSANVVVTGEFRRGGAMRAFEPGGAASRVIWPATPATVGRELPRWGDPNCPGPPDPERFYPHGIAVLELEDAPTWVAAVDHGDRDDTGAGRDKAQLFELSGAWPDVALHWRGCVQYPEAVLGNDLALSPDGSFVTTNFSPTPVGLEGLVHELAARIGLDTGDVMRWSPTGGWKHLAGTDAGTPNGIVFSMDGETIYFADNGRSRVAWLPRVGLAGRELSGVRVGGPPDNVTRTSHGTILTVVANLDGSLPFVCEWFGSCRIGWALWEVDPLSGEAQELLRRDGSLIGSATSGLQVGPYIYIGNQGDDRLGVWRRP